IAFIDGETEYCSGDELFLTYSIGNNDDGIDEFLLPEWVNVDINLDTKTASLSGIIPDYDEENSIIEFEVKSISSYNPIACPGASINQYITIKPSHLKTLNIEICEGESYEFAGSLYTESTNTSYNYINEFACDSIVNLNLIVNPTYTETISIGICDNEIYEFAGVELNETGEYSHTFESINGCDSIVNLNLLVYPTYTETLNVEICEGEYYEFAGQNLSESGEYSHSFESIFACDSIVNLNLTLNPITITNLYEEICEGDTYFFNNEELSEAGEYQMLIENIYACNDITNLNLEVNPNYNIILNKQICEGDSYEFDGITYLENTNITKTFTSFYGCDSIINLNLEFVELFEINLNESICEGEVYEFAGEELSEAGVFSHTYESINGCDSVVNLNLIVNPTYNENLNIEICDNDVYDFAGVELNETGVFSHTYESINGCDSVVNLNLIVNPTYNENLNIEICDNEVYEFAGEELNETGEYSYTFESINGCDSIVNLNLIVNPTYNENLNIEICDNEVYDFAGEELNETGEYSYTFESINGCDSIVNLNLIVNPTYNENLNIEICDNEVYYFAGEELNETGEYSYTFESINGCDSIVNLNLIVFPAYNETMNIEICQSESYEFFGEILTQTGNYSQILQTINNCDSIIVLNLTVHPVNTFNMTKHICEGEVFTFHGQDYSEQGNYTIELENNYGCFNIWHLELIITPSEIVFEEIICEGESYVFNNEELYEAGEYSYTEVDEWNCATRTQLNLTLAPNYEIYLNESINHGEIYYFGDFELSQAGEYSYNFESEYACDSIVNLSLTYTTNIKSNFNLENLISIYPNPTNSMLYIEIDDKINNEITINITDITGQIIIDKRRFEKFTPINLSDYMTGVYFLNIYSKEKLILTKIIIKN
ncbi:MAG: T9SS type A sorting domain-containing protein, partial [Bacteroidales bacterium]|nr:T9SS type A sorting domain-containing protein [Bacteroidales bacterium]